MAASDTSWMNADILLCTIFTTRVTNLSSAHTYLQVFQLFTMACVCVLVASSLYNMLNGISLFQCAQLAGSPVPRPWYQTPRTAKPTSRRPTEQLKKQRLIAGCLKHVVYFLQVMEGIGILHDACSISFSSIVLA